VWLPEQFSKVSYVEQALVEQELVAQVLTVGHELAVKHVSLEPQELEELQESV
jgi:hypothetical protein